MKIFNIIFIISIVLIIATPSKANENRFKNGAAGFEITKPSEWSFISAEQNSENIKRVKFKDDEEYHKLIKKYAIKPLVTMMKYHKNYNDLNPAVQVVIKPLGQLKTLGVNKIMSLILPQYKKMFNKYKLVQPPTEVMVSGLKTSYARINYSLEIPDGRIFLTSSEFWVIPNGDLFFMIGASTREDEKSGSRKEIEGIINSIKIKD